MYGYFSLCQGRMFGMLAAPDGFYYLGDRKAKQPAVRVRSRWSGKGVSEERLKFEIGIKGMEDVTN